MLDPDRAQIAGAGNGAPVPAPTARESIEYVCRFLAVNGIDITAETLRQAKFDGDAVRCAAMRACRPVTISTRFASNACCRPSA